MRIYVIIDEFEVGAVSDDVVLPDGLYRLDQRVVDLNLVFIEEVVGLHDDVKQAVLPALLESGKFGDFANALVDQMLNLAVYVDV